MKVMVLAGHAPSLTNFRGPMLKEFVDRGHEVIACAPDSDARIVTELAALGVRYGSVPLSRASMNPVRDLRTLLVYRSLIAAEAPDLILAYTVKPIVFGLLAARWCRVKRRVALVTGLGYAFTGRSLPRRLLHGVVAALYRLALRDAATVFFQNPDDARLFVDQRLIDAHVVHVVPGSGVDLDRFPRQPLSAEVPTFLLIARLIEEKGIVDFVEAARIVRRSYPQARFQVLGAFDPNPSGLAPRVIQDWVREGVVEYLGETDDVRPFLAACTVFVLPSYYGEGTPRTVLEAMATGRAVITTDVPGCRETVEDGRNGYLVAPRNPPALASAMLRFLDDPRLVHDMAEESHRRACERYDVNVVNAAIVKALGL